MGSTSAIVFLTLLGLAVSRAPSRPGTSNQTPPLQLNPPNQYPPLNENLQGNQSIPSIIQPNKPNRGFIPIRDTVFRLFTRTNERMGDIIRLGDVDSLKQSKFNPAAPSRFIIHDWMNEGLSSPTTSIRDAYLQVGHYNVFIVDWDAGSLGLYLQSRDQAPLVGRVVAQFIDFMVKSGQLDIKQIVLVGYGLGAHIAGVAGKTVTAGRLPVIYALDPIYLRLRGESPIFSTVLTHLDADYVEVIHTNVITSHLTRPIGHANFYVNFGMHQPGCFINPIQCSHERAYKYFAESITSLQGFYGIPCGDFHEVVWFKKCKRSAGPLVRMGGAFPQMNRWGLYVVRVNPTPPFARGMIE